MTWWRTTAATYHIVCKNCDKIISADLKHLPWCPNCKQGLREMQEQKESDGFKVIGKEYLGYIRQNMYESEDEYKYIIQAPDDHVSTFTLTSEFNSDAITKAKKLYEDRLAKAALEPIVLPCLVLKDLDSIHCPHGSELTFFEGRQTFKPHGIPYRQIRLTWQLQLDGTYRKLGKCPKCGRIYYTEEVSQWPK